jgi:hypothetical protein
MLYDLAKKPIKFNQNHTSSCETSHKFLALVLILCSFTGPTFKSDSSLKSFNAADFQLYIVIFSNELMNTQPLIFSCHKNAQMTLLALIKPLNRR